MPLKTLLKLSLMATLAVLGTTASPVQAQTGDMFPNKAAALKRAKELKCSGAFAMGSQWMPCKDLQSYEQAIKKQP
jgi:hypothetical protein